MKKRRPTKTKERLEKDDIRPEYDFGEGGPNPYADGSTVVVLEPQPPPVSPERPA
jgi:hypothetical protein